MVVLCGSMLHFAGTGTMAVVKEKSAHQFLSKLEIDMHEQIKTEIQDELNPQKMRRLVREFGIYPTEHRIIIWRYLLSLPQNTGQFRAMIHEVPPCALSDTWNKWLARRKDISKRIYTYMTRMLRWLATWNPELSSISFLPDFILPFVRTFRTDLMTCFELLITIINNWGSFWLEMNPLPPFNFMCVVEQLLQEFGPGTFSILKERNVTVTSYAWPLMEHGFSLVLDNAEWLQLWDHLLANNTALMFSAVVAYASVTETSLRAYSRKHSDIQGFYIRHHPLDMRQFLRKAYEIFDSVTNWPEQLVSPLTCLPKGKYPGPRVQICEQKPAPAFTVKEKFPGPSVQNCQEKPASAVTLGKKYRGPSIEICEQKPAPAFTVKEKFPGRNVHNCHKKPASAVTLGKKYRGSSIEICEQTPTPAVTVKEKFPGPSVQNYQEKPEGAVTSKGKYPGANAQNSKEKKHCTIKPAPTPMPEYTNLSVQHGKEAGKSVQRTDSEYTRQRAPPGKESEKPEQEKRLLLQEQLTKPKVQHQSKSASKRSLPHTDDLELTVQPGKEFAKPTTEMLVHKPRDKAVPKKPRRKSPLDELIRMNDYRDMLRKKGLPVETSPMPMSSFTMKLISFDV